MNRIIPFLIFINFKNVTTTQSIIEPINPQSSYHLAGNLEQKLTKKLPEPLFIIREPATQIAKIKVELNENIEAAAYIYMLKIHEYQLQKPQNYMESMLLFGKKENINMIEILYTEGDQNKTLEINIPPYNENVPLLILLLTDKDSYKSKIEKEDFLSYFVGELIYMVEVTLLNNMSYEILELISIFINTILGDIKIMDDDKILSDNLFKRHNYIANELISCLVLHIDGSFDSLDVKKKLANFMELFRKQVDMFKRVLEAEIKGYKIKIDEELEKINILKRKKSTTNSNIMTVKIQNQLKYNARIELIKKQMSQVEAQYNWIYRLTGITTESYQISQAEMSLSKASQADIDKATKERSSNDSMF